MATRWFSDDNSNNDDEADKNDAADKTEVGDGESVEDLLGDLDELAEWLGDEQLGSELEDIADFFQGEAAERYKQYANETYAEMYDSVYEGGPESEDYVPFDDWTMAKESSFEILSDPVQENDLRDKLNSIVPPHDEEGLTADSEAEGQQRTPMFRPRDPPMDDGERGIVESRAKFRRAKAKKIAYDKWKEHLFGYQIDQYTAADQLVMHNAPALTVDYAIGVRPMPVWEVLRAHQQYPEDEPRADEEDDTPLMGVGIDELRTLSPTMAENVRSVDQQFDDYSSRDYVDDEGNNKVMSVKGLMENLDVLGADAEQDEEQAAFFKVNDQVAGTPDISSQDFEKTLELDSPSEKDKIEVLLSRAGYVMHHIYSDRVSNMTAKGKVHSIRVLVVLGNQHGTAGFATSRAESEEIALDLACKKAVKNLMYLDLYKGNSLHEPLRGRCHSTHALIWPGHPNGGLRVGKTMWAVCDCFGIHNASGKIIGRNNPHAVIPAIFSALLKYRPLDHVTLGRGRRLYDIRDAAPRYMMGF